MIPRPSPLPEPPEPNAWLSTWPMRAAMVERAIRAATDRIKEVKPEDREAANAELDALKELLEEYAAKGDGPIWPGAWLALPGPLQNAAGWRIRGLFDSLDKAPEGTVRLPYLGAAIGLCWRACDWVLRAVPPRGLPDKWTDAELLTFGWQVIAELHEVGLETSEISDVGAILRVEVNARLRAVGKEAVDARARFFGQRPAIPIASSAKPA